MRIAIFFAVTTLMVTTLSSCRPDMAEFSALKERVAALEGQTRAMEGHSEVIKTSKVEIVDKDGKVRGVLGLRDDGTPELRFVDDDETNRLLTRLHPDGTPILVMWGKGGKGTAYLSVPGAGPPNFMMFDKDGTMKHKVPK